MAVANPFFVYIELFWPNGSRPTQNEVARVKAFDVNGSVVTEQGQSGFDAVTGGWQPIYMQNIAAFYPPRERPNLRFEVWSTSEQRIHTTQVFSNIASGSTVRIVIGQGDSIPDNNWLVSGKVLRADGSALTAGTVVAYDVTDGQQLQLGVAPLGPGGAYSITYTSDRFNNHQIPHSAPNLKVAAFSATGSLLVESEVVVGASRNQVIDLRMRDESMPGQHRVFGSVRNGLDLPVEGVGVEAYHLAWTASGPKEVLLAARVTSDARGRYEIRYAPPTESNVASPCNSPVGQINLMVYARERQGTVDVTLASVGVLFDAAKDLPVALFGHKIGGSADSEYRRIHDRLYGCLGATDDARWTTLNTLLGRPEYLSFLSKSSGLDEALVRAWARSWLIAGEIAAAAAARAATTNPPAPAIPALNLVVLKLPESPTAAPRSPEIVYGLVRAGLGDSLGKLLELRPDRLFDALIDAVHQKLVSTSVETNLNTILSDWKLLLGRLLTSSANDPNRWQSALIRLALPSDSQAAKREIVANATFDNPGSFADVCRALVQAGSITAAESENLLFVFDLYDALGRHLPITTRIYAQKASHPTWHTLKDLATVTLEDWYNYVFDAQGSALPPDVPGANPSERARVYAARLFELFGALGDQTKFNTDLQQSSTDPQGHPELRPAAQFLSDNPTFDLESGNIETFSAGLPPASRPNSETVTLIKRIQRVFRLTSDFAAAMALVTKRLDSAIKIAQLDEDEFVVQNEKDLGGLTAARNIYRTAAHYANEVLFTVVKYNQNLNSTGGATAIASALNLTALDPTTEYRTTVGETVAGSEDSRRFPNWTTLFGDLNKCACKECQTVLSPGAYLVDTLQFIERTFGTALFARRPDLLDLEITCPNTDRMLPYIDLVNELLEAVVVQAAKLPATFPLVLLAPGPNAAHISATELDSAAAGDAPAWQRLRQAFFDHEYVLGDRALVKRSASFDTLAEWLVEDDAWRYRITGSGSAASPFRVLPVPQTSSTNDSLEVFPEHYNPAAYAQLAGAVFPFNLPLDVGKEEVNIFLKQRGVYRHEILETFTVEDLDARVMDETSALAYLELTPAESRAILAQGRNAWEFWGFAADEGTGTVQIPRPDKPTLKIAEPWVDLLCIVPVFLHRSGLSYQELLDLLDTQFVHQTVTSPHGLHLTALAKDLPECNYNAFQIAHLDATAVTRIGVFVRLWRKLGWTMREVDRYLMTLEGGAIPTNLVRLARVKRVADELKLSPLATFALWRTIDTRRGERTRRSWFDEVFLIGAPSQPEYRKLENLVLNGVAISLSASIEEDYPSHVRAALKIRAKEMDLLWQRVVGASPELTLEHLSHMYRLSTFAGALGVSLLELDDLLELTGAQPLPDASSSPAELDEHIGNTHAAVRELRRARKLRIAAAEANYYLRNTATAGAPYVVTEKQLAAVVQRLAAAADVVAAANPDDTIPSATSLSTTLAKVMPADKVVRLLQAIETPPVPPAPTDPDHAQKLARYQSTLTENRDLLWRYFASFLGPRPSSPQAATDFPERLLLANSDYKTDERFRDLWEPLSRYLLDRAKTDQALAVASELVGFDRDSTDLLLSRALSSVDEGSSALEDWRTMVSGGWLSSDDVDSGTGTLTASRRVSVVIPKDGSYRLVLAVGATADVDVTVDVNESRVEPDQTITENGSTYVILPAASYKFGSVVDLLFTITMPAPASETVATQLLWELDNADRAAVPTAAMVPFLEDAYLKLYKAVSLLRGLAVNKDELRYLVERLTAPDEFSLDRLPLAPNAPPIAWPAFASFVDLVALNRVVALKTRALFELIRQPAVTIEEVLAELDWKRADLDAVLALWAPDPAPDLRDPQLWYVIHACRGIALRLNLSVAQVASLLVAAPPSVAVANALRNVYRARFDKQSWKDAFKPLRDKLRQRQRDALVGYLTSRPVSGNDFFDANDLYSYYLIDVEMEPDTLISRLKLALNVVQLYVERIFLGLEPDTATYDLSTARELWAWMRSYRVWEANRKVFLYPENWIEPELRDDKTEFFVELEDELQQDEISSERGQKALHNYLDKLAEVSNLEVVGAYAQSVGAGPYNYILHVVGRTRYQPRTFYYRTFQAKQFFDGDWTPWRRINLEINADVVAPAVFNGRLHLFWPMVQTKQRAKKFPQYDEDRSNGSPEVNGRNAYKERGEYQSEIRLMWSEYVAPEKKWLKPCVSKGRAVDFDVEPPGDRELGQDTPRTSYYHLRIDEASSEQLSVGLVKTNDPPAAGKLGPKQLGSFVLRYSGHDAFNGSQPPLWLGDNYPVGTVLRHNGAEEVQQAIEDELSSDSLRFKNTVAFLRRTPETYRIFQTNFGYLDKAQYKPFFVETDTKSFFALNRGAIVKGTVTRQAKQKVAFSTFHHPQVQELQNRFRVRGPAGIMDRLTQALPVSENYYYNYYNFRSNYYYNYYGHLYLGYHIARDSMAWGNTQRKFEIEYYPDRDSVERPFPLPTIEFGYGTPFGTYNWELFFHIPALIADRLSSDLKFEEAMHWYHYVFDPKQELNKYELTKRWATRLPPGCRYWNFLPFFANKQATDSLLDTLGLRKTLSSYERADLSALIDEWRRNPFNPHLIARQRIVAYQKNVVMKYLDNLIAWGDQLFRLDTFESINRATQLYVLAAELLGQRPEKVEPLTGEPRHTYRELKSRRFDGFSNAMVEVEYMLVGNRGHVKNTPLPSPSHGARQVKNIALQTAYFAVPRNERLDKYWDTVADRLFKIRNSMNIDGIKRQLALFEPPIDPALLVRAAAAGVDLSSVLAQLNTPLPNYRFNIWIQKAVELCNEVRAFGGALLSALEKKDAEELQLLRQGHEIKMLELVRKVRQLQIQDAEENIKALERSRALAEERLEFYRTREKTNGSEKSQIKYTELAADFELAQGVAHSLAAIFALIPDATGGIVGPFPSAQVQFKIGSALYHGANTAAAILGTIAGAHRATANMSGINAGHERRWDDWQLQLRLAQKEIEQIDQQMFGAQVRLQIAEQELDNHEVQMEHAEEVREFLTDKFTNRELYLEMIRQLSRTYQQVYKLAYDVAKTAERTFQFELGVDDTTFVQFGYMNSLKMGLLAGEQLIHDLKRMDIAYLERNKREFEITKPISLAALNGRALQQLRDTGACTFEFPEVLFDLDYPGQYFRRIKTVRVTIPCVTGPHTSVSAKLTLLGSAIRKQSTASENGDDYRYQGYEDPRFVHDLVGVQSIATSSAQNDSGLFELNFRDERYLPFEGAGAISRWRLELPTAFHQFDYQTISDVVVHLSYTARDAGGTMRVGAENAIRGSLNRVLDMLADDPTGLVRVFSLRKEFPDVLHQLVANPGSPVELTLVPEHFPYILHGARVPLTITEAGKVGVALHIPPGGATAPITMTLTRAPNPPSTATFTPPNVIETLNRGDGALLENWNPETWRLTLTSSQPDELEHIEDIVLALGYSVPTT